MPNPSPVDDPRLAVLGERVRDLRMRDGLTQVELADRAGLERKAVNRLEAGLHWPPIPNLIALADALGVPPGDLIDGL